MEKEIQEKTKKDYSKISMVVYFYALGYFLVSNAWFCYFASQKTANKIVFYLVAAISIIFAIFCFTKINLTKSKKNKKAMIIGTILDVIISVIIIYLGIKIICISHGGPLRLF